MARALLLRMLVRAILMILAGGCTGVISGGAGPGTGPTPTGTVSWAETYAALQSCTSCHSNGPGPTFLAGGTAEQAEDSFVQYNPALMDLSSPLQSLILTKGQHEGPELGDSNAAMVLAWIQQEADENGSGGSGSTPALIVTPPQDISTCSQSCAIYIDVSALANAPALPGAHISFEATAVGNSLYTTGLAAYGGTAGLYLAHPVFLYVPPTGTSCSNGLAPPCPDGSDRFSGMKLDVPAGQPVRFDGGHTSFQDFAPVAGAQLEIVFEVLEPYHS